MAFSWYPLWLSLEIATVATAISLLIGICLAWMLASERFPGRHWVDAFVTLPLVLPPTVLGYYLLAVFARTSPFGRAWESIFGSPLVFTWKAAVLASTIHAVPLLVRTARAGFESADPVYLRAARSLGAGEFATFWRVALPLARRSIWAAAVIAFARSLGDFGATLMVAGDIPFRTQTASIAIYDAVEAGNTRMAGALTLVISVIAIVVVYIANRFEAHPAR